MTAFRNKEEHAWLNSQLVGGIDEAGRGPLAGPCVVAGVVLPPYVDTAFIDDSKTLSEKKREQAYELIQKLAVQIRIEIIDPKTIDELNIYRATQVAMEKIGQDLECQLVLTDAMPLTNGVNHESLIKGDHLSISIACASIIAKVTRDRIMAEYDQLYPEYGFKRHKGYPTAAHYEAIERYGLLDIHRRSFRLFKQTTLF